MAEQETRVRITEPHVMRALAHPARIAIVEHLTSTGEAVTATQCAGLVGLSPSATSYHLRELAKVGMVEQAPSRGDGRERLWRSTTSGFSVEGDLGEPETRRSQQALVDVFLSRDFTRLREWVARQHEEPEAWQEAATLSNSMLLVTAAELTELNVRIQELIEPYRRRERITGAPSDARPVAVHYAAFPVEEGLPPQM
ncbi:helix-turn-helix domain-containing protein [Actinoplanes sp. NPDC049548]|uniref:helix-turn-helix domain-containing protein n=1 Tax=Actinoplanes sp. NPDC049548 TaxID=3155152 RepID=UPI003430C112